MNRAAIEFAVRIFSVVPRRQETLFRMGDSGNVFRCALSNARDSFETPMIFRGLLA